MRNTMRTISLAVALAFACTASAADYPNRPVRVIVGFPPGGAVDVIGRAVTEHLSKAMTQNFYLEAKPGAAGNIAGELVAKAPPDGYTLYLASWGSLSISKLLYKDLPYDPTVALTPITIVTRSPMMLDVSTTLPVNSYADFIAYAKAHPTKLNHGSVGNGTLTHLAATLFSQRVGIQSEHIPYRGNGPLAQAFAQGEVQWAFDSPNSALTSLKTGAIKVFAVTGTERHRAFHDVPTLAELGHPDADWMAYFALVGPAGLPKEIALQIAAEVARGWNDPAAVQRLQNMGFDAMATTPEETTRIFQRDYAVWSEVIRSNNIKPD